MRGGGNIQLLLVKVTGPPADLDAFYGVPQGSLPQAVADAGFGESDYSKPYLKRLPAFVEFTLSGGWRIYNNIRESLAIQWPNLTFEVYSLDVDYPEGEIYVYKGKHAVLRKIREKALPLYAKCVFGPHDFGNARRLTRKARGKCRNYKVGRAVTGKRRVLRRKPHA